MFRVKKLPPSGREAKPASEAIWIWYFSAPATGVQLNAGSAATVAPFAGDESAGRLSACAWAAKSREKHTAPRAKTILRLPFPSPCMYSSDVCATSCRS